MPVWNGRLPRVDLSKPESPSFATSMLIVNLNRKPAMLNSSCQQIAIRIMLMSIAFAMQAANAQSTRGPNAWWSRTDYQARELYSTVAEAQRGTVDAQIAAAGKFAKGYGSTEGPKFDVAHYWLQRAADKGSVMAVTMDAVIYAIDSPSNMAKAGEMIELSMKKEDPGTKPRGSNPIGAECKASPYCAGYTRLIAAYCGMFIVYPVSARREGKSAQVLAEIDIATREIIIKSDSPPEFSEAAREVLRSAFDRIPRPAELPTTSFRVQLPLNFQLE